MTEAVRTGEPGLITQVLSSKGLAVGAVGLFGATVIGVSTVAPAYTFTISLGPAVAEVGTQGLRSRSDQGRYSEGADPGRKR